MSNEININDNVNKIFHKRRPIYTFLSIFIHTVIGIILFKQGLMRLSLNEFIYLFAFFWLGNTILLFLLKNSTTERYGDPVFTFLLMLWTIFCVDLTLYFTNTNRSVLILFYLFILVYGSFRLEMREFILMTICSILSYTLVIILLIINHPETIILADEYTRLCAFILIALFVAAMSSEFNNIHQELQNKNTILLDSNKKVESLSITDELTAIRNRRYILSILEQQRLLSERGEYQFTISIIDIDYFKAINDKYGHAVGDQVLKAICEKITTKLRRIDYFARMGGEEFIIVSPLTDKEHAAIASDRIRAYIEEYNFDKIVHNLKLRISIGVTDYRWPEEITETLNRADEALYQAKNQGRNRIVVI